MRNETSQEKELADYLCIEEAIQCAFFCGNAHAVIKNIALEVIMAQHLNPGVGNYFG